MLAINRRAYFNSKKLSHNLRLTMKVHLWFIVKNLLEIKQPAQDKHNGCKTQPFRYKLS